jgi:hypothetical protein
MAPQPPELSLVLQDILVSAERASAVADAVKRVAHGSRLANGTVPRVEVTLRDEAISMYVTATLGTSADENLLDCLTQLGFEIWHAIRAEAVVGPEFVIRPLTIDHARPLPPRFSRKWSLADAALFVCPEFHAQDPRGDPDGAERLRAAPVPASLVRETRDDLTVIRCRGPAEDLRAFGQQLYELERWISTILGLQLNAEYNENGDHRLGLPKRENAEPFTIFDPMRGFAFKALPDTEARDLAPTSRRELERVLQIKQLEDGRNVRGVYAIFPTRAAAVHNVDAVRRLGAVSTVYVGKDSELWDPRPPGNWIRTDWK